MAAKPRLWSVCEAEKAERNAQHYNPATQAQRKTKSIVILGVFGFPLKNFSEDRGL